MRIKISRAALDNGIPKAYTVKVNGRKFPKGFRNFYFVTDRDEAKRLALNDYLNLQKNN